MKVKPTIRIEPGCPRDEALCIVVGELVVDELL
jgi:hypothetical protein